MSALDETEDVLRELHLLFAKAEPISSSGKKVIMDKAPIMELLKELNECIVKIMDEHEVSRAGRDRATREQKRQRDHIVRETKNNAEDIYAAAMMYTDRAIDEVSGIISENEEKLDEIYKEMKEKLKTEKDKLRKNKTDLHVSLSNMEASEKYMKLIEEENERIAKEKAKNKEDDKDASDIDKDDIDEPNPYAAIKPEIKINPAYFEAIGKPLEGGNI